MASETDQLATDFEKVKKTLEQYPHIKVVQVEGDPPDCYEVEYQLKGFVRNADGSIEQTSMHLMRINLPFGYPHFPPTVKPLTPVFHPDIDPDAVRIASYWQQTPSLAELILHIGEMICGDKYNLEEPFNQEAADWYAEHPDDLPLDKVQVADGDSADEFFLDEEDGDLDAGLDVLALEVETPQEDIQETIDEIQAHIDRREIVTASKLLVKISDSSPELNDIRQVVSSALNERDQLIQELEQLENEDKFTEAFELFEKVKEIAIDTPALSDIGHRLKQSQTMLDAFAATGETAADKKETGKVAGKKKKKPIKHASEKKKDKKKTNVRTRNVRKARSQVPVKAILAVAVLLSVIAASVHVYIKDSDTLRDSGRAWVGVKNKNFESREQFRKARIEAERIQINLESIFIPGLGQDGLQEEISALLSSPEFKRGEAGEEIYKGQRLPLEAVVTLKKMDKLTGEAEALKKKGLFEDAVSRYKKALTSVVNGKIDEQEPHSLIVNSLFNERAEEFEEKLNQLRKDVKERREREEIEEACRKAVALFQKLEHENEEGRKLDTPKKSVTAARWQEAVDLLQRAEELLRKKPERIPVEKRNELERMLAYSRLYQVLAYAQRTYKSGDFKTAIREYREALLLLDESRAILSSVYNNTVTKIHHAILMLEISLELRAADEAESKNDLKNSLKHYRAIKKMLASFATKDKNIIAIEKHINAKIKEQSLTEAKNGNQEWLKKSYKKIFRGAYPSTRSSILSSPRIKFIKLMNGQLLYKITCSERKRGSSYRLELYYLYNPATGRWTRYLGKVSARP
jgi:ubiquitin-protein ligase